MDLDLSRYEERDPESGEEWLALAEFMIQEALALGILDETSASILRGIPSSDRLRALLRALRITWRGGGRGDPGRGLLEEARRMVERALWPRTVEEAVRQMELRLDEGTKRFIREASGMFLLAAGAVVVDRMRVAFGIPENEILLQDAWRKMGEPDISGWALEENALWFIFREYWVRVSGGDRSRLTFGYERETRIEEEAGEEGEGGISTDIEDLLEKWRSGPAVQPLDVDLLVSWVVIRKMEGIA